MIEAALELLDVRLEGEGLVGGRIARPPRLAIKPGQYLLAHAPALAETLPTPLFPSRVAEQELILAPCLPPAWLPGTLLTLRGPLGSGFHLPAAARRVALATLDTHPMRLLPLLEYAMAQRCEIVLVTRRVPADLSPEVEVLSPAQLPEAPGWADYLALDLPVECLPDLRRRLGLNLNQFIPCPAEILITGPMPCGGTAECGVCAVKTRRGWTHACKDGPVYDFNSLEMI